MLKEAETGLAYGGKSFHLKGFFFKLPGFWEKVVWFVSVSTKGMENVQL